MSILLRRRLHPDRHRAQVMPSPCSSFCSLFSGLLQFSSRWCCEVPCTLCVTISECGSRCFRSWRRWCSRSRWSSASSSAQPGMFDFAPGHGSGRFNGRLRRPLRHPHAAGDDGFRPVRQADRPVQADRAAGLLRLPGDAGPDRGHLRLFPAVGIERGVFAVATVFALFGLVVIRYSAHRARNVRIPTSRVLVVGSAHACEEVARLLRMPCNGRAARLKGQVHDGMRDERRSPDADVTFAQSPGRSASRRSSSPSTSAAAARSRSRSCSPAG